MVKKRTFNVDGSLADDPERGLVPSPPARHEVTVPSDLQDEAREFFDESLSKNTRIAYKSDWRQFVGWCRDVGHSHLPAAAGTVVGYLTWLARSHPWSTISRHLTTVSAAHRSARLDCCLNRECSRCKGEGRYTPASPRDMVEVRTLCRGIRRKKGVAPEGRKKAIVYADLERVVAAMPVGELIAVRDRAIVLLGFAAAFRRSELSALDVEHLDFEERGLAIFLARSKTDQEGKGAYVGVGADGARTIDAVREWIARGRAGVKAGPVFTAFTVGKENKGTRLAPADVGDVVLRALERAGVLQRLKKRKPAGEKRRNRPYGAHSLRAGYATQAKNKGRTIDEIMGQGRWRSYKQAMEYVRRESIFDNPGSRGVAL